MKRTISLARAMRATALALCIASTAGVCVAALATGAVAQVADPVVTQVTTEPVVVPIDVGATVVSLIDIVWTSILGLIGVVVTWAVATLRPVLQSFLSASVIDMAAKRIEAAAKRAVEGVLGELRERAGAGNLTINVGSVQIASVVNYLMAQVPMWLKLAGMDKAAVERFVTKLFGQEMAAQAAVVAAAATVATAAAVSVDDLHDAVKTAVRDAVADPMSPLTVVSPGRA
jgi:hypothetical protein